LVVGGACLALVEQVADLVAAVGVVVALATLTDGGAYFRVGVASTRRSCWCETEARRAAITHVDSALVSGGDRADIAGVVNRVDTTGAVALESFAVAHRLRQPGIVAPSKVVQHWISAIARMHTAQRCWWVGFDIRGIRDPLNEAIPVTLLLAAGSNGFRIHPVGHAPSNWIQHRDLAIARMHIADWWRFVRHDIRWIRDLLNAAVSVALVLDACSTRLHQTFCFAIARIYRDANPKRRTIELLTWREIAAVRGENTRDA